MKSLYKLINKKKPNKSLFLSIIALTSSMAHGGNVNNLTGQDIGNVGIAGSYLLVRTGTIEQPDIHSVRGSGADIWGNSDQFHFAHCPLSGDGQITVRLETSATFIGEFGGPTAAPHPWAKVGIMIRETLAPNSKNAALFVTGSNGVRYQSRGATGSSTLGFQGSSSSLPDLPEVWLRIIRNNFTFTAFESPNGVDWTQVGISNIPMSTNVFVGFAVTSHDNSLITLGQFTNPTISNQLPVPYVSLRKLNAINFAIDGGVGGSNGQNVYLWQYGSTNVNQQWEEISRGGGFYTYKKRNTNFVIDGGNGGALDQNVYLWTESPNNQNQHWRKVDAGAGFFRLEKRNSPAFSIDGNVGGSNGQNIKLWSSQPGNQNQHWLIQ